MEIETASRLRNQQRKRLAPAPAILAITRDTLLVYTSNVFAILDLRALYFLLAAALGKLVYLQLGLAAILVFVGPPQVKKVYTVHMKRMTATEARRQWFRLLDEVAAGETVLIERDGTRLVLKIADPKETKIPDYQGLIHVPDADHADQWGWEWDGSPESLKSRRT